MRIRERHALLSEQHLHFSARLIESYSGLEPGDRNRSVMNVIFHVAVVAQWPPQIDVAPDLKRLRQNADDSILLPVEQNIAPNCGRIGSETPLPESVAQKRDRRP